VAIILCSILLAQISVQATSGQLPLIPLVSTREHFRLNSGELRTDQHNTTDYTHLDIPGLDVEAMPSGSGHLHSWSLGQRKWSNRTVFTDHYRIPVVGFTWDSNTAFSPDDLSTSEHGWKVAKKNS